MNKKMFWKMLLFLIVYFSNLGNICYSAAAGRSDLLFFNFAYELQKNNPYLFTNHELLDGVIMKATWRDIEPAEGKFDFAALDKNIGIWTDAGKSVILRIVPYGQTAGNRDTPKWIYGTVPSITFVSKKISRGKVRIPIVWESPFIDKYSTYITEGLAKKYNNDPRVKYVEIGIGHIGYTTAQPSQEGEAAFLAAGWTLEKWEAYVKQIIDIFAQNFPNKKLIVTITPTFTRENLLIDNLYVGKIIADYAAARNYNILFKGIDQDISKFEATGIPALVRYLLPQSYPALSLGYGDDWPLYGVTGGDVRTEQDFQAILDNIYHLWTSTGEKYPLFAAMSSNELAASEVGNAAFNPLVYNSLLEFLNKIRQ